jgi:hypothetical protein
MSYENTVCPCGDKKPADTMLCDECYKAFRDRREMDDYQDPTLPLEYRRHAAVVLVALARGRKPRLHSAQTNL